MGAEEPGLSAPASVDALVERLRERVEERRRTGSYPAGLEEDLDAHFRHVAATRRGTLSLREHLEAVREASAFAAENISTTSRIPVGSWFHRAVARAVARQTQGVLIQVTRFANAVQEALDAMAEPLEALGDSSPTAISQQLESLSALVTEQQRSLNAQRTDLLGIIERRVRDARPVDAAEVPFRPWYESERFEVAFRGSRKELLERYRDLAERLVGCDPVVDVGFGRGEFLELLDELGVAARGVENDPVLVKRGAERGLDVAFDDANSYLRAVDDEGLGGLVLIQVVEHLTAQDLVDLVALAARKLRRGGKILVETVNPQSLYVFARSFYLDPTHVRPVHPGYLEFLFREAGFSAVETDWRNPPREQETLHRISGDDENSRRINANIANLNALLFAPQDYAIIATR